MVIKHSLQRLAAALAVLLCSTAFADTVTLKSGEKIVGKVTSETDTEVVIEERVSASISDPRTIQKADIVKIDKESPDQAAYQAIRNLKPGANSLPASSYEQAMKPLEVFLSQHPQSTHAAEIKTNLSAFEEDKKRVAEGAVKLNGNWLSKEEAAKERYQINGQVILNHMRDQQRRGDMVGAMNTFDQLEQTYPGSRAYPDAVELAKQILPILKTNAEAAGKNWQFQKAERDRGIQLLSEPTKSQTIAANEREQKAADAAVEAANRANLKWPPLIARSESALNTIASRATEEVKRLAAIELPKIRESLKTTEEARKQLAADDITSAEANVTKAISLWSANEAATRLQADVNAARSAASATATSTTTDAEAAADGTATEASTGETAVATTAAATDDSATEEAAVTEEEAVEEEKGFFSTLPGRVVLIVLVIFVLVGLNALRKMSKRSSDAIE